MDSFQAYCVAMTKKKGSATVTFFVDNKFAALADRIIGVPDDGEPRLYTITPYVDAPSPYYQVEEHKE